MNRSPASDKKRVHKQIDRHVISTDKAPKSVGPFSQAILAGDFIFVAGQGAFNPSTGNLVE